MQPNQNAGQPAESNPTQKVDYKDIGSLATGSEINLLAQRLEIIADTGATALLRAHIDPLIAAIQAGEVKLRQEDLDLLVKTNSAAKPLCNSQGIGLCIDRNLAHLYFAPDGTFSKAYNAQHPGSQLLHGVCDVAIRTPDGALVCIQWVDADPRWRNLGIVGGHVPSGMDPADAGKKEVPEELNWKKRFGEQYAPQGRYEIVGERWRFPAPNAGDAEAKTLGQYWMTDRAELAALYEEQAALQEQLAKLGEAGFLAHLEDQQRNEPGQGEIWAIHLLTRDDLRNGERLAELNVGVDLLGYLKEPVVQQALLP